MNDFPQPGSWHTNERWVQKNDKNNTKDLVIIPMHVFIINFITSLLFI